MGIFVKDKYFNTIISASLNFAQKTWLSNLENKPKKVFLVHGENIPADELRIKINEKYGFDCVVSLMGQEIDL